ncbi:MAG: M20 metallopeptidase family protein [Pyrinomonadaceae bacterium]
MKRQLTLSALLLTTAVITSAQPPTLVPNTRDQRIARAAEAMRDKLITQRRDFHMHPELSNREVRTARVVAERLRAFGFDEVKTGVGRYGIVALLKGKKPGPVVAVRADMDALPVEETRDVPYKSQTPGVMHACGHDLHMTVALGVAEILGGMREEIAGTIKFIFQPAEEGPPPGEEGGAKLMVKEGALENPRPLAIFGLHTKPDAEVGQIVYQSGPSMATADRFFVTLRGKKTHGAYPHEGVDAIYVAAQCLSALQSVRSRRIDPTEPLVISVGSIHGGNRFNIIADEVKLEGTMRTLSEDVRRRAQELVRETLAGVTAAHGAAFELKFEEMTALTYNEPRLVEETLPGLRRVLGDENVLARRPQMGAEDFSYFQRVVPGFYIFLGTGNKAKGITAAWHTPEFDVDEASLVVGTKMMATVLLDFLDRHQSQ